jgi:peptide deformylase
VSLRPIHLLGSPVLRERATEVAAVDDEVRALLADLFDTMRVADGVGLAANQIGVARRVAVVTVDGTDYALINPVIVEREGKAKQEEGCLSLPDVFADVQRPARVVVEAMDEHGVVRRIDGTGMLGRAIQHEIDHLDGILIVDRVGPLKRRRLLAEWQKSREGATGYLREVTAETTPGGRRLG